MKKIRVLQAHIANQIAAGEVVERPASVIKELVENALDAGANAIAIEVDGMDYMRVTDNGAGIPAGECALAFLRHATSKISAQEDLTHIETLGFRGEALASIAAVAQVELKSRQKGADEGMRVRVEGGEKKLVQPAGCPEGTTIVVENLFYNVPARRKFLKSLRSELGFMNDYVLRMILARPDVAFRYTCQKKPHSQSTGDGQLRNAIFAVYGPEMLAHLREVAYDDGYVKISGFIGAPEAARPNRGHQSFFLNGRFIHSTRISGALSRAYDTLLMGKKYPFAVLHIVLSSREVDVNVHPTKLEARFAQENRVMDSVARACAQALNVRFIPEARFTPSSVAIKNAPLTPAYEAISIPPQETVGTQPDIAAAGWPEPVPPESGPAIHAPEAPALHNAPQMPGPSFDTLGGMPRMHYRVKENEFSIPQYRVAPLEEAPAPPEENAEETQQFFSSLPDARIVGQAFGTYWMLEHEGALYIIDQHAAHERVLYERLMAGEERAEAQTLLMPEHVPLSGAEYDTYQQYGEELQSIGFETEALEANTVRLMAVPLSLADGNTGGMLRGALESIRRLGSTSTKELRRGAIIQAACKHAVKAGDILGDIEIRGILDAFLKGGAAATCPHGRPLIIKLERRALEKMFKRIV